MIYSPLHMPRREKRCSVSLENNRKTYKDITSQCRSLTLGNYLTGKIQFYHGIHDQSGATECMTQSRQNVLNLSVPYPISLFSLMTQIRAIPQPILLAL